MCPDSVLIPMRRLHQRALLPPRRDVRAAWAYWARRPLPHSSSALSRIRRGPPPRCRSWGTVAA
eukprot:5600818-Pyramimonas_sp.AAC.1